MAFTRANFCAASSQANNSAPRLWMYRTTDTTADCNTSGYFNDVANELTVGDLIYAHTDTDGTPGYIMFPVVSNASGVVDVSDGTALETTDSD